MPQLKLIALECIETEDSGEDEAYLRVKGVKVWGRSINSGQTADLSGLPLISFNRRARIELYDEDWPDADDLLGITYAIRSHIGQGEIEYNFTDDDANYKLTFEVLA
ncbi:MAG: hypothetical protein Fur006_02870 [Coleofasciculaceae cyanobacterium]